MKRLCRRLDLPTWQGVGLLESLWHLTARETPRGDIGKLNNEDIALAIDYRGDEAEMIEALIGSGWIDRDAVERLVVHDWHTHADDAVHMRMARAKLYFAGGFRPKLTRLPGKEREEAEKFYASVHGLQEPCARIDVSCVPPEPEPLPEPEPVELIPPDERAKGGAFVAEAIGRPQRSNERALRETLTAYVSGSAYLENVPPNGIIQGIAEELGGGSTEQFCQYLQELPARFRPGGKREPEKWGWFRIVARRFAAPVQIEPYGGLPQAQFEAMTNAIELPEEWPA